ncbi:hypothetical protein [Pseudogulbenkiania ferrooxidans]|uniref:Acyl carrier protein n=1 Tax=Pseudogulbenkiania ferrooxidans EGD-HP2 TaxID=1388764 RepID=A0ABP2XFK4_9NEIS|nr:hypothetical protein [Pseudogulbenkiania ferrooxidans]ERD99056.1 hypothetical protein O166_18020 [Pseudogulbenkiania ferrooxidans EGD-HP2]
MQHDVRQVIEKTLRLVAEENLLILPAYGDDTELVDEMGFTSVSIAMLLFRVELELGVDPFLDENVRITDIRTVGDLCRVYSDCLAAQA